MGRLQAPLDRLNFWGEEERKIEDVFGTHRKGPPETNRFPAGNGPHHDGTFLRIQVDVRVGGIAARPYRAACRNANRMQPGKQRIPPFSCISSQIDLAPPASV
jgi:hypothetical protein